jgi:hypothetical protein
LILSAHTVYLAAGQGFIIDGWTIETIDIFLKPTSIFERDR